MEITGRRSFKKYGIAMVLGVLLVFTLEVIYFFQMPYPKGVLGITKEGIHISETVSRTWVYTAATITQLLLLIWPLGEKRVAWKRFFVAFAILLFLRIVCDLIQYIGTHYLPFAKMWIYIPLEIMYVCSTYLLAYKLLYQEKISILFCCLLFFLQSELSLGNCH